MAIDPLLAGKITYILGWTNILGLLLVLLSCRCGLGSRIRQSLSRSKTYRSFYSYHCYYWWFFIASVATHAVLAIIGFGNPFG